MRRDRWQIVVRLLDQLEGTTGRLVLAVAPQPLNVVLYEMPVLARTQPPHNPLRGFIQDAISLLGEPTAADIASLFQLPSSVVELVLGNLQQIGGVCSDVAGRWMIPPGAPLFRSGGEDPPIWRRRRHLLCYWPERNVMLPVLPRMRLRDLVELGVHNLQGEVKDWYAQCVAWSRSEAARRGLPPTIQLLPLIDLASTELGTSTLPVALADSPVSGEEVLVSRCKLDVIALTWASPRNGVWELSSRIWSRPTPPEASDGEPFAPGEHVIGLSLPEHLLGIGNHLDDLGTLFDPRPDLWRTLLEEQEEQFNLHRDLNGDSLSFIMVQSKDSDATRRWHGLSTRLAPDARLICSAVSSTRLGNENR